MKKNFSQILGELDNRELDMLLNGVSEKPLTRSAEKRIRNAIHRNLQTPKRQIRPIRRAAILAASLLLLISVGFGTHAVVVEAKEYREALAFFEQHDLSTEGLTRAQIKAVYRDITTESFTYSKTAEIIIQSLTQEQVEGFEILQEDPTPEDVANLWHYKNYISMQQPTSTIQYKHRTEEKTRNDKFQSLVFDKSYLEKYDGDKLVWSVAISEFQIWGHQVVSDGVIAYGRTPSPSRSTYAWLAKISNNGKLIWKLMLDNGFSNEHISEILENSDGSYAVFSRGDYNHFCLSQVTSEGTVALSKKTEVGTQVIWDAAHFGDGYIVQLGDNRNNEYAKIVKVDRLGNITDEFSYSSDDSVYYITDMIEFNGNIYLSAYATPTLADDETSYGNRVEIARILDYVYSQKRIDISSEELTPVVRDNYTAVLLICAPDSGVPQEFYSVKGSLGGTLAISDSEQLLWDVESITSTYYSPLTSSFTIGGTCYIYRYTYSRNGAMINQEKTGEVTRYAR